MCWPLRIFVPVPVLGCRQNMLSQSADLVDSGEQAAALRGCSVCHAAVLRGNGPSVAGARLVAACAVAAAFAS